MRNDIIPAARVLDWKTNNNFRGKDILMVRKILIFQDMYTYNLLLLYYYVFKCITTYHLEGYFQNHMMLLRIHDTFKMYKVIRKRLQKVYCDYITDSSDEKVSLDY